MFIYFCLYVFLLLFSVTVIGSIGSTSSAKVWIFLMLYFNIKELTYYLKAEIHSAKS